MNLRVGLLACMLPVLATASPGLHLEGGPFLPYRLNHAVAVDAEGLSGLIEVSGVRWDGARVSLFRAEQEAQSQSVELAFYVDEDIRGLELKRDGVREWAIDLAAEEGKTSTISAEETALRARMRGLDPPVHLALTSGAPERFSLMGSDLVLAGFQASSALFGLSVRPAPWFLLAGFALVASLIGIWSVSGGTWRLRLLRGGATLAAALAVTLMAVPEPTFFRVLLSGEGPGARVSGTLERRVDRWPGYTQVTYAAGEAEGGGAPGPGSVDLVGLWTPAGTGIPVPEVAPGGSLVRFSSPPRVIRAGGDLRFASADFITGWVVHANR